MVVVSAARDSLTIDGPRGRGTMGLRPAALIRVIPGEADPSLFHQVPQAIRQLFLAEAIDPAT